MEYKNLKIWGRSETALTESHALKDIATQLEHHDESLALIENDSKEYYASKYGWSK